MEDCKITGDSRALEPTLSELSVVAQLPNLPLEIVNRLIYFLDLGLEVGGVETLTAFGTSELRIGLKFPDGLREFVSALRAGNVDGGAFV